MEWAGTESAQENPAGDGAATPVRWEALGEGTRGKDTLPETPYVFL